MGDINMSSSPYRISKEIESSSFHQYSFPKTQRFYQPKEKYCTEIK